jgi:hypothetical protein
MGLSRRGGVAPGLPSHQLPGTVIGSCEEHVGEPGQNTTGLTFVGIASCDSFVNEML